MHMSLANLQVGERARIASLTGPESLQQRLQELGLLPATEIRLVRRAPLGDPIEVEILGYRLSLRRSDAAAVWIEALSP
jgi:ferrous iron transport protein A